MGEGRAQAFLPSLFPALWAAVGEKGCETIFSRSVPWQEGRAEKHGAGKGAGQGEGKKTGRGVRKEGAGTVDRTKKYAKPC